MAAADTWNPELIARTMSLLGYGQAYSDEGRLYWVLPALAGVIILIFVVLLFVMYSSAASRRRRNPRQ
jgi:hypothetical protein